jgi:hypothetical protein
MHTSTAAGALKLCTKAREQIESKIKDVTRDSEKDYKFQVFELKVTMRLALVGRRCCCSRWCTCCRCCSGRRCRRRCSATCSLLPAGFTRGLMEVSIGYAMAHARPFSKQSCQACLSSCCRRRRRRGCASYVRLSGRDLFLRRRAILGYALRWVARRCDCVINPLTSAVLSHGALSLLR